MECAMFDVDISRLHEWRISGIIIQWSMAARTNGCIYPERREGARQSINGDLQRALNLDVYCSVLNNRPLLIIVRGDFQGIKTCHWGTI